LEVAGKVLITQAFSSLSSLKKSFRIPEHCSSNNPQLTSTLWLKASTLKRSMADPAAPAFKSEVPIYRFLILA